MTLSKIIHITKEQIIKAQGGFEEMMLKNEERKRILEELKYFEKKGKTDMEEQK